MKTILFPSGEYFGSRSLRDEPISLTACAADPFALERSSRQMFWSLECGSANASRFPRREIVGQCPGDPAKARSRGSLALSAETLHILTGALSMSEPAE